jgi:Ca2+-binding RTX toxin-like protein
LEAELAEANSITIIGGAGNDFLDADGVLTENHVIIIGGAGNDSAAVGASDDPDFDPGLPSEIGSFLHVILGAGNDDAFLVDVSVDGHILVDAGSGNDEVVFDLVEATDWILALMGSGNLDVLDYSGVTAGGDETLDGGPGNDDTLFIDSTAGRRIRNFENVVV